MLLEFRVKNFRSIAEEQVFSMVAGKSSSGTVGYSTETQNNIAPYAVNVATIAGPNASGKSNLILAMRFFRYFILNSFKEHTIDSEIPTEPFKLDEELEKSPSELEVSFVHLGQFYQYGFVLDKKRIYQEWLYTKPKKNNTRMRTLFNRAYNSKDKTYLWQISPSIKGEKELWQNSTRENALFLSTATQLNATDFSDVLGWLKNRFKIMNLLQPTILHNSLYTAEQYLHKKNRKDILNFIKSIDDDIIDLESKEEDIILPKELAALMKDKLPEEISTQSKFKTLKLFTYHKTRNGGRKAFDFNDESDGTRAVISMSGLLIDVLKNGYTLVVDEMQNSLHPLALQYIVELFMNPQLNTNGAQLIFTTHDTNIFDTLTKDQIWLVKKGKDFSTKLIPLSDFNVRSKGAFGRAYLAGKFGALPNVKGWINEK